MPILRWRCAHGEAPAVTLEVDGPTVAIAPFDESIDTNLVRIQGSGTIFWFGEGSWVTKRVIFAPGIVLKHNPPQLDLLTSADRVIRTVSIGIYSCDGDGNWIEVAFTGTGIEEVTRRLEAIERRLDHLDDRLRGLKAGTDAGH